MPKIDVRIRVKYTARRRRREKTGNNNSFAFSQLIHSHDTGVPPNVSAKRLVAPTVTVFLSDILIGVYGNVEEKSCY